MTRLDTDEKKKLRRLIRERPQQVSAFKSLARMLCEDRQYREALNVLRSALRRHPDDPDLPLHLARTYHESGNARAAVALYRRLIARRPDDPLPYEKLERLYRDAGKHGDAVALYERIPCGSPLKEKSHSRLHYLLVEKMRDFKRGARNLAEAIKKFGPNYRRCKDLGRIYGKLGKWRDAAECYRKALDLKKDDADLIGLLGWTYLEAGEHGRAEECFTRIKGTFQGAISLAELSLKQHRADKAGEQLKSLAQRYPDNSRVAIAAAELALIRGDAHGARERCCAALPRIPPYFAFEQAHAHEVLAGAGKKLGDTTAARHHAALACALKKGPDTYTALITLAEKSITARRLDLAEAALARVLELYPGNARALLGRGGVALARKKPRQAAHWGEEALRGSATKYPDEQLKAHTLLAQAYRVMNDASRSRRHRTLAGRLAKG